MEITTPAIPASGTPQANPTGQDVNCALTGGTVTNVTVTTAAGVSSTVATSSPANYMIPAGGSHTITWSVTPTGMTWTDPNQGEDDPPGYAAEDTDLTNELTELPAAHGEGGETGLGEAVQN